MTIAFKGPLLMDVRLRAALARVSAIETALHAMGSDPLIGIALDELDALGGDLRSAQRIFDDNRERIAFAEPESLANDHDEPRPAY